MTDWIVLHQLGPYEWAHPTAIAEVVGSPDNRWLACLLRDGQGTVWERAGARKHLELTAGKHLGFSHDSESLFWQQDDHIEVIALESGQSIRKIGPVEGLQHFALSPSGQLMALAAGSDVFIGEWQTGKLLQRIPASSESVWPVRVAFLDDERLLCAEAVKERGFVQFMLWEIATGKALWTVPGEADTAREFVLSADRERFASRVAGHNTVRIWQTHDGTVGQEISVAGEWATAWAFTSEGAQLVMAGDENLEVHHLATGEVEQVIVAPESTCLALSPAGEQLIVGGTDGRLRFWDLPGWDVAISAGSGGHQSGIIQLLPLNDECVLCRSSDPELRLLALDLGAELVWGKDTARLESLVYDKQNGQVVGVRRTEENVVVAEECDPLTVLTWNASGELLGERQYSLKLPANVWQCTLSLSPDAQWLAGGGSDQVVRVWSLETGEQILEIVLADIADVENEHDIALIEWWPGAPLLAVTRMSDGRVHLVDAEIGKHLRHVGELESTPHLVEFLPGTTQFLFADYDDAGLALHDLATRDTTLLESPGFLTTMAAFPGGQQVALAYSEKVGLYDVVQRRILMELSFPFGQITSLAVTPDGTKLIAGSEQGQLMVWERR
ncbi:WD40 repeat domain-containing protein [Armatimonas sp.]|uniref:WD40 repeat domain-containing protein n=1 Tax=Armatimonas sp. TaxID=1872638 RepID=UPI00286B1C80|nr:WD40 repeat domain-containing protein [Armatimonas sp.]